MSILDKYKPAPSKGLFSLITALRLGGKSTLAGTLPGKTAYVQAAWRETGRESAVKLSEKLGNNITCAEFENLVDLDKIINEVIASKEFDHLYIDGLTAISHQVGDLPQVDAIMNRDQWKGFAEVNKHMASFIRNLKQVSVKTDMNIFLTLALKYEANKAGLMEMTPDCYGKAYLSLFTGMGPAVLAVNNYIDENGEAQHELITKSDGMYSARIDSILTEDNPGKIRPASLATVLELVK